MAGGIVSAYEAQCCYFKSYFCIDIVRLIESLVRENSFDLDLSDCPLVRNPLQHKINFKTLLITLFF